MPAQSLVDRWLDRPDFARHRIRFPSWPWNGYIDPSPLEAAAKEIHGYGALQLPLGIVTLQWKELRQVLFKDQEITWEHLAASCAIPLAYPQYKLNGQRYGDGGMLGALPIWAAIQMGATHIVAIDISPRLPAPVRYPLLALKRWRTGNRPSAGNSDVVVVKIAATPPLGNWSAAISWNKDRARRYVDRGRADAIAAWEAIS
jgi:NTE family protein